MNSLNRITAEDSNSSRTFVPYIFPDISSENAENAEKKERFQPSPLAEEAGGTFCPMQIKTDSKAATAEKILQEAENQAGMIRARAHEEGFARGYDEGFAEGEKQFEYLIGNISNMLSKLSDFKKSVQQDAETQAVELALAIARKIIYHEVSVRKDALTAVIHKALQKVHTHDRIRIRISPADYGWISGKKAGLLDESSQEKGADFWADESLQEGDCIVDSSLGKIDARLETRIRTVESAMRSLLQ
ncbi:MAG: FliH/SctL family protein [Desulfococcaceae bacterium]|jgi:flagellar assembly protein FliH|nr:FliH/SctL family protein [Desulfococcaceae bacterium]